MSILIKGMEMPKNCMDCPMNYDSIDCTLADNISLRDKDLESLYEDKRHPNCPLIEVPKHGRLIDADAFNERIRLGNWLEDEDLPDDFRDGIHTTLLMLKTQRTIIEAEGEDG